MLIYKGKAEDEMLHNECTRHLRPTQGHATNARAIFRITFLRLSSYMTNYIEYQQVAFEGNEAPDSAYLGMTNCTGSCTSNGSNSFVRLRTSLAELKNADNDGQESQDRGNDAEDDGAGRDGVRLDICRGRDEAHGGVKLEGSVGVGVVCGHDCERECW